MGEMQCARLVSFRIEHRLGSDKQLAPAAIALTSLSTRQSQGSSGAGKRGSVLPERRAVADDAMFFNV